MSRGCKRLGEINPSMDDALVKEPTTPIILMTTLRKSLYVGNKTQWTSESKSLSIVLTTLLSR